MCGICVSVVLLNSNDGKSFIHFEDNIQKHLIECLKRRGPDSFNEVTESFKEKIDLYFCSSVLHLRGPDLVVQPVTDERRNIFMWNGEIFEELIDRTGSCNSESDTSYIARRMFNTSDANDILHILKDVKGPYAFIFYEVAKGLLWFGRDIFGRRSLLWNFKQSAFQLCSLAVNSSEEKWEEVPTIGVFCLNLNLSITKQSFVLQQFSWSTSASGSCLKTLVELPVHSTIAEITHSSKCTVSIPVCEMLNKTVPLELSTEKLLYAMNDPLDCNQAKQDFFRRLLEIEDFKDAVDNFETVLSNSVRIRIEHQLNCCKNCYLEVSKSNFIPPCIHSSTGVLFSGGLDSLVIAYLTDRYVDPICSIDLLNVAFAREKNVKDATYGKEFDTPDRITGKMGFQALKSLFPSRKWNFVEINVTDSELNLKRVQHISELLYPSCSVLDDSIGCALWFASQGKGYISVNDEFVPYQSPARVLLVGMGADEQLAGYTRHRAVFKNASWLGLVNEISLELDRIGSRNLGRDDRIIADNGVESRYPFLDEKVVSFLNSLPIWLKANLNLERGIGEKLLLRLLAFKLGLTDSAMLPKRAIQFGSRIAKLENSKEKGSDICTRLLSTAL